MTNGNCYSWDIFETIGYKLMSIICIQSTASLLAIWISFRMHLNARIRHSVAIWEIVCMSFLQSQEGVVCNFHFNSMWLYFPWPVLMRFSYPNLSRQIEAWLFGSWIGNNILSIKVLRHPILKPFSIFQ